MHLRKLRMKTHHHHRSLIQQTNNFFKLVIGAINNCSARQLHLKKMKSSAQLLFTLYIQCYHGGAINLINAFQPVHTSASRSTYHYSRSGRPNTLVKADNGNTNTNTPSSKRKVIRDKVSEIAKKFSSKPTSVPAPQAIASILTDSTRGAVDLALEEVNRLGQLRQSIEFDDILEKEAAMECDIAIAQDTIALAKTTAADAFALAETAIDETEEALRKSKRALAQCRLDVSEAISVAEKSAYLASIASQKATLLAARAAISASDKTEVMEEEVSANQEVVADGIADVSVEMPIQDVEVEITDDVSSLEYDDVSSLEYDDVDYHLSEMTPPFIGEDQCLVPGEAVVRVEKAKDNSRRIFAGIDILASVDDVWNVSFRCLQEGRVHMRSNNSAICKCSFSSAIPSMLHS